MTYVFEVWEVNDNWRQPGKIAEVVLTPQQEALTKYPLLVASHKIQKWTLTSKFIRSY